ncbi:hypothetical protein VB780_30770 [Leptolyngbya sp. CCNP1308]|nr:hypothetical protein [Leptolyngbya sp. CCNP1308]
MILEEYPACPELSILKRLVLHWFQHFPQLCKAVDRQPNWRKRSRSKRCAQDLPRGVPVAQLPPVGDGLVSGSYTG